MTKGTESLDAEISRELLRLRDHTLLEGAMATAALVALADHRLAIEESLAVKGLLESATLLKLHDPEIALGLYTRFVDRIRRDHAAGWEAALEAVARCSGEIEAAEFVVHVGITIAKADRELSEVEIEAIDEICARVGITGLDALALAGRPRARSH